MSFPGKDVETYKCLILNDLECHVLKRLATVVVAAELQDESMIPSEPTEEEMQTLFELCNRIVKEGI